MAEIPSHVSKTLEDLKQQLAAKMAEIRRLLGTINDLEEYHGLPKTVLQEMGLAVFVHDSVVTSESVSVSASRGMSAGPIRPDEYLGEDPLKAAKKYIRRVGHAVHLDEIADAISKGGAAVRGSDWRDKLEKGLIRSTYDIVKVQEKTFGLTDFYTEEQLKNLRVARRQRAVSVEPGRKRGRPRKQGKRATEGSTEKKTQKAPDKPKAPSE